MQSMVLTTRALVHGKMRQPGHKFSVAEKEARLWGAIGKAKAAGQTEGAVPPEAAATQSSEIDALRADYKSQTGQDADPAWNVGRLKNEIRKRYNRRDMRAES